jgi:hypothetical protein
LCGTTGNDESQVGFCTDQFRGFDMI